MRRVVVLLLLALCTSVEMAVAQPAGVDGPMYYVVKHHATVYTAPDSGRAYLQLGLREPVFLKERHGAWSLVRTQDGAQGFVETSAISNVWIRVSKRQKSVFLYEGTRLVKQLPADFGYNVYADKERRGSDANPDHWRTPEGVFFVAKKNPYSKFYKAFVLNYPTAEDADRGLRQGLISEAQYRAIVQAEADFAMPPMGTALGGMIEIHGNGTGASTNWTQGCVAVHNDHIDQLWDWVAVGTPVLVER